MCPKPKAGPMPSAADAAKGIDDHALAGMLECLANALDFGVSPVVSEDLSRHVREARNRARWLRERAEAGPSSGLAVLAAVDAFVDRWLEPTDDEAQMRHDLSAIVRATQQEGPPFASSEKKA